jgi:energy-coupling factor transporter ATP-binding protein EcfA2
MEIIMTDLIDNQFCRKSVFENVMFTLLQPSEHRAQIIWDTIEQATDLLEFRSEMISCNV